MDYMVFFKDWGGQLLSGFCIIGGMAILVVVLTFLLIRFYIYYPRKKRANELIDDNFDYKEGDKNQNIIIPPEGDNNTENKI